MADFALEFDKRSGGYDLVQTDGASGDFMATDLRTAVLASLLTWGRAGDDDALPDFSGDRKGWWGDGWPKTAGDKIGSRLWIYARSVLTSQVMEQARQDASDALAWMIEDGLASSVTVVASRSKPTGLRLDVTIYRPDGTVFRLGVDGLWPR